MVSYLKFRWSAFDTFTYPFETTPVKLFAGEGPAGDRVTNSIEPEALRWLLRTPVARDLLFEELRLPIQTYAQTDVVEPLIDDRKKKPGDVDLLLAANHDPERCISIQAKRIRVKAIDISHDKISRGSVGRLTDLVDQANASRNLGFHLNYALVIIQVDGIARCEANFLSRGITSGQMSRIYEQIIESPVHPDVGIMFLEISQPTQLSVDRAGMVALCIDKRAIPLDQPKRLTTSARNLMANCPSR